MLAYKEVWGLNHSHGWQLMSSSNYKVTNLLHTASADASPEPALFESGTAPMTEDNDQSRQGSVSQIRSQRERFLDLHQRMLYRAGQLPCSLKSSSAAGRGYE